MNLEVIILAAGQGTRMRSSLPKVLHPVAGRPLLQHVVDTASRLQPRAIHVVVGHGADTVRSALSAYPLQWVEQTERLGTGHAVLQAMPAVDPDSTVLVLYGDVPLIEEDSLQALVELAGSGPALLTARLADPAGYGRVLRDSDGAIQCVVEDKDASAEQRAVDEINTGVLAAPASALNTYLPRVGNDNQQGEYYLPDILSLAVTEGVSIASVEAVAEMDVQGVNDRVQLNTVEREYQKRQAQALLRYGTNVADISRIDIRGTLQCGVDVSIDVGVVFEGDVSLADGVTIGPNCVLKNVSVGAGAVVHAMSHLEDCQLAEGCSVGPFARLRTGTVLAKGARIGNFVETKKANIGAGSKVNHLSYVGDCDMGSEVNIGAGTITCNYDGVNKHQTVIGSGSFVGSNSTLVAPIEIAEQGFVAAGSAITKPVGKDELAVGRGKQRNVSGWVRPTSSKERGE
ncbi:MAG: bifunctional UDP-N-acetylglucosamine diphosphorylase/glucosamine-1-phosphate N-acetyltransferase GlmU [Halieaceae bacterium]